MEYINLAARGHDLAIFTPKARSIDGLCAEFLLSVSHDDVNMCEVQLLQIFTRKNPSETRKS